MANLKDDKAKKTNKGGRPSLFTQKWSSEEALLKISGWAKDGLTNEQIAELMGISETTLYEWQNKYPEFADALKVNKDIADRKVENALYVSCQDRVIKVQKAFKVKHVKYDKGKRVSEDEEVVMAEEEIHIPANTTAQIFWLKNRKPEKWRDKNETELTGANGGPLEVHNMTTEEMDRRIRELTAKAGADNG